MCVCERDYSHKHDKPDTIHRFEDLLWKEGRRSYGRKGEEAMEGREKKLWKEGRSREGIILQQQRRKDEEKEDRLTDEVKTDTHTDRQTDSQSERQTEK